MTHSAQTVSQGINAQNHAVAKILIFSTGAAFLSLAFIAFGF